MTINATRKIISLTGPNCSFANLNACRVDVVGGGPALIWSTDFNLGSDWSAAPAGATSTGISGLSRGLYNATSSGNWEEIITAASRPGSTGVRGQRHWKGAGTNNNSGGTEIDLTTDRFEFWIRWYMRYQSGFAWNSLNYDKWLIFATSARNNFVIPEWKNSDQTNFFLGGSNYLSAAGKGWQNTMGGATSDGQWHLYECHVKVSTGGGSNGVGQIWIDGNLSVDYSNLAFGATLESMGFRYITVGSNQATPNNGGDYYVDYDDIAISTEGYIGQA